LKCIGLPTNAVELHIGYYAADRPTYLEDIMPNKKPSGTDYSSKLAAAVKKYHNNLMDSGRRKRHENPETGPVNQDLLAVWAGIDAGNFSKLINCKKEFSKEELFQLISMPWITEEEAQSWIFLWVANELDKYKPKKPKGPSPLLEDLQSRGWNQKRKLKLLGDSLEKLTNYVATLGVIDQIDHARCHKNKSIKKDEYRLPVKGPLITRQDINKPTSPITQKYWSEHPRTRLVLKFAQDLADLEADERLSEINGYLNEETEISDLEKNLQSSEVFETVLASFSDNKNEEVESILACLGSDTTDRVIAAEIANKIITFAKATPPKDS
jgi:hypothetical protein